MKTGAQIQFDFAQARRRAEEIDETAEKLLRVSRKDMQDTMTQLSAVWRGDNARQYFAKSERLREEIKKTATELNTVASNIRIIARRIYEAEMEALRIATQDTDGGGNGGGRF